MALNGTFEEIIDILPTELATKIDLLIGALGGIAVIYLIFQIVNFVLNKKRGKIIEEMRSDIKFIKENLKKKKKN